MHSGTPGCINPIKKRFWSFSQYLLISYIPLAMTATSLLSASLNSVLSRSHMCLCWDYFNKPHVFQVCHCCLTWLWDGDTGHSLLSKSHSSCWERLTLVCFHTEKKWEWFGHSPDCISDTHQCFACSINGSAWCLWWLGVGMIVFF